jgi:hypothetical protein
VWRIYSNPDPHGSIFVNEVFFFLLNHSSEPEFLESVASVEKIREEIRDIQFENNIIIDDSFIERISNYKTADELFETKDR